MNLKELRIRKANYGPNEGKYVGVISFSNKLGNVELVLSPEQIEKLFATVADELVSTAKEAATNLTCTVIEHKASIEAKSEPR